ncbi:MAG: GNAT family N-acetyltransferase [Gemmatimonadota bacterium]
MLQEHHSLTSSPDTDVSQVPLQAILPFREEYRREMNCQIVHDSWHARGFTNSYLCRLDDEIVGYGSVGGAPREPRDTVKEFFVLPTARRFAVPLFRRLVAVSGARTIEAQTNDVLLTLMLFDCGVDWESDTILFADVVTTGLVSPRGVTLRPLSESDRATVFSHTREPVGEWGLEYEGKLAATGGLFFHYNPPYGDIYMEVAGPCKRRGFGSYLVQELKRMCREMKRVPAARCHKDNDASRRTLERAGMFPCARILRGRIGANNAMQPSADRGRGAARRSDVDSR